MVRRRLEETLRREGLPLEERILLSLGVLVVLGRFEEFERLLPLAARERVPLERVRETLLETHLFAGIPRTIEAFERLGSVVATGVFADASPPLPERKGPTGPRGVALFRRIYAGQADAVRLRLASHHPDLERWILEHAYGRVLGRPALNPRLRELFGVAFLVALRAWRQLPSHLRGAIRCGASTAEVLEAIRQTAAHVPSAAAARAERLLGPFVRPAGRKAR